MEGKSAYKKLPIITKSEIIHDLKKGDFLKKVDIHDLEEGDF